MIIRLCLIVFFCTPAWLHAQTDTTAFLNYWPRLESIESKTERVDWKAAWVVSVPLPKNADGELSANPHLFSVQPHDSLRNYLRFSPAGSETDVFVFRITHPDTAYFSKDMIPAGELQFFAFPENSNLLDISLFVPGFYYIPWTSCNSFGSYILHLLPIR